MKRLKLNIRDRYPGAVAVLGDGAYPYDVGAPEWCRVQRLAPKYADFMDPDLMCTSKKLAGWLLDIPEEVAFEFINKVYVEVMYDEENDETYAIYNHDGYFSVIKRPGKPKNARRRVL